MKKNLRSQDSLRGIKARKTFQLRMFSFVVMLFVGIVCFAAQPKASTVLSATMAIPLVVGGIVKKDSEMNQEEKDAMATIVSKMNEAIEEFTSKNNDPEILTKALETILKEVDEGKVTEKSGEFAKRLKEISTWGETIKQMALKLESIETKGLNMGEEGETQIQKAVKEVLESEKFKAFAKDPNRSKESGKIKVQTKAMSLGTNHTGGNVGLTNQSGRITELVQQRKVGVRDILTIESSDEPYLSYDQIIELDRNAAAVSENGVLPESSFKTKEISDGTHRIGTYIMISKRMLRAQKWLQSRLSNLLPAFVRLAEDFNILKGDGNGENINGIMTVCPNAKDVLGANVLGAALSVKSVSSYKGGAKTLVEFVNPQSFIGNGATITFAAFANAAYNAAFTVNKVTDRTIVIDVAYTAQTQAQCDAATFAAGGEFSKTVVAPTIADAVMAVQSYLTYAQFYPTGISMSPIDVFKVRMLKDTQDRYLDIIKQINGVWYIGNLPIIETTAVVPDEFVIGDFTNGASLVDFSTLELEFAEDTVTKKANQVMVIVQEEVIFPIYNPYAFLQGKFSEAITLITKA